MWTVDEPKPEDSSVSGLWIKLLKLSSVWDVDEFQSFSTNDNNIKEAVFMVLSGFAGKMMFEHLKLCLTVFCSISNTELYEHSDDQSLYISILDQV